MPIGSGGTPRKEDERSSDSGNQRATFVVETGIISSDLSSRLWRFHPEYHGSTEDTSRWILFSGD